MSSLEDTVVILKKLSSAYPTATILDDTIQTYSELLADVDTNLLRVAAAQHMATSKYFPTIAELRNGCKDLAMRVSGVPATLDAYDEAMSAMPDHQRLTGKVNADGIATFTMVSHKWSHPFVERAAKQLGWPSRWPTDNRGSDYAQFREAYEGIVSRAVEDAKLLPATREALSRIAPEKQLTGGQAMLDDSK